MGLRVSHGCFDGPYAAFNRIRAGIVAALGGSWPPHADPVAFPLADHWYIDDAYTEEEWPGLFLFLNHSDCDGSLTPTEAALVARDFDRLTAPEHRGAIGLWHPFLRRFSDGCALAATRGETVLFY